MAILFSNDGTSLLVGSLSDSDPQVDILAGTEEGFPKPTGDDYFMITIEDIDGNREICRCIQRVGPTLIVERGQEGTLPLEFLSGARVEMRMTDEVLSSFAQSDTVFDGGTF